ncbi:MAG: pyridoxal phosphate-dependent aminotransferase [Bacteroidales bacterium]|nr:pyridoxal phosphate-dependent aminotransferase [Bacteroidales bacterium]
MKNTPIDYQIVSEEIAQSGIEHIGKATIREIKKLVDSIEQSSNTKFIRMEMGIPGLPPTEIGVRSQVDALERGVAAIYPDIQGIPTLKKEMARFVKNYMNIEVEPEHCLPTVGSMQGGYASFMTLNRMYANREGTLFLDPGFPVHKQQLRIMGQAYRSFDVYNFRGDKLGPKLEEFMADGKISSILYSNPNNPSWICFTEDELKTIGRIAQKYDVVVIEDLAYFGMDFRKDYSKPGQDPYQPSVANYCDKYILLISSSKAFSYAGERIGMLIISDTLFTTKAPDLRRFYGSDIVGTAFIFGSLYALSSGTSHSAQYALAAILKSVNDGEFDFVAVVKEYGEKAAIMKKLFTDNGFKIVYDTDIDQPIADGFYFTFSYPGFSGEELLSEMLYYGISAIALSITGSERLEGIRACVSLVKRTQFADLEYRLKSFHENHPLA